MPEAAEPVSFVTHDVICGRDTVTKRFQRWGRAESEREWQALHLLAEHAPGLAPEPISADLDAQRPVIVMSRLPGKPLSSGALSRVELDALVTAVVFTQNDGNLANFLWDGQSVRVVDFEDAGKGDRAQEIAGFVEHLAVWDRGGIDADTFLSRLGLSPAEHQRVARLRPLCAAFWLMMLMPGGPAHFRNPAGTLDRQAARLLGLLDR